MLQLIKKSQNISSKIDYKKYNFHAHFKVINVLLVFQGVSEVASWTFTDRLHLRRKSNSCRRTRSVSYLPSNNLQLTPKSVYSYCIRSKLMEVDFAMYVCLIHCYINTKQYSTVTYNCRELLRWSNSKFGLK